MISNYIIGCLFLFLIFAELIKSNAKLDCESELNYQITHSSISLIHQKKNKRIVINCGKFITVKKKGSLLEATELWKNKKYLKINLDP